MRRRYSSRIVTIIVGPFSHKSSAHESVLSVSPVLAALCQDKCPDKVHPQITLPEDTESDFGKLLNYLYRGSTILNSYVEEGSRKIISKKSLAGLFVLAQKSELPTLKGQVMEKIKERVHLAECPAAFFELARKTCDHVPMDAGFRT